MRPILSSLKMVYVVKHFSIADPVSLFVRRARGGTATAQVTLDGILRHQTKLLWPLLSFVASRPCLIAGPAAARQHRA